MEFCTILFMLNIIPGYDDDARRKNRSFTAQTLELRTCGFYTSGFSQPHFPFDQSLIRPYHNTFRTHFIYIFGFSKCKLGYLF